VISVQVLEGQISFSIEQETTERSAGQMLALNARILHSILAKEASVFLLTLSGAK
jgi:quercetin dioxygenase-like cupin family protein